jgi:hypothetical protein
MILITVHKLAVWGNLLWQKIIAFESMFHDENT